MQRLIITNNSVVISTVEVSAEHTYKTVYYRFGHMVDFMEKLTEEFAIHPRWYAAQVFSFNRLTSPYPDYPYGYRCCMETLLPITQAERDMVYVYTRLDDMLEGDGLKRRFSITRERAIEKQLYRHNRLYGMLKTVGPYYPDLHEDQVMKTKSGTYKVVDLESFHDARHGYQIPPLLLKRRVA